MNTNEYQLNEYDRMRIEPFKKQIENKNIKFKYLMTLDYWFPLDDYSKALQDNKRTRVLLRSFFASGIRLWFWNEKHTNPSTRNYGGLHRHILLEDPSDRWKDPSPRVSKWLWDIGAEPTPKGTEPTLTDKLRLLKKVVQRLDKKSVAQGSLGVDIREIHNLDGVLSYCSKQFNNPLHPAQVFDLKNSLDIEELKQLKIFRASNYEHARETRHKEVFERVS